MKLLQPSELQNFAQISNRLRQPFVVGQLDDGFVYGEIGFVVIVDAARIGMFLQTRMPNLQRLHISRRGTLCGIEGAATFEHGDDGKDIV